MKLKRDVLGVVLAFMTAGFIATEINADAYQKVYDTQTKQEQKIHQVVNSEFISNQDKKDLQQTVIDFDKAKTKENRDSLQEKNIYQEKLLTKITSRLEKKEAEIATKEYSNVASNLIELTKKSNEVFIPSEDEKQVEDLAGELEKINSPQKVKPVRQLAEKMAALATRMTANQAEMKDFVNNLKEVNKTAVLLQKNKFLTKTDKSELGKLQKENEEYFKDADSLITVQKQYDNSNNLLITLQERAKDTEQDFRENEKVARKLIQATNELLAKGDLNSDERAELNGIRTGLNEALSLKNYQPGDLSSSYTTLKISYDSSYKLSNERKEQTKRLAQEAARKKAEEEKAAQKQTQANTLLNNKTPAPIPNSGGWNQAPAGYKFLKVESGKTYGQVKNPDNFRLITEAEAAKYTPGHGNGSAKQ